MKLFESFVVILSSMLVLASGFKKSFHPAINVCKRNDPNVGECICENIRTMIPLVKDGVPEMNIPVVDPIVLDNIVVDLRQTQSVQLVITLFNVTLHGLKDVKLTSCNISIWEQGFITVFGLNAPVATITASYNAKGSFSMLRLNTTGDCYGTFTDIFLSTPWETTKYVKNGKEYLKADGRIIDFSLKNITVHFNNLFGNNTEMNDSLNSAIAENIDILYKEIKPIALDVIMSIAIDIMNNVAAWFPYDVLLPPK